MSKNIIIGVLAVIVLLLGVNSFQQSNKVRVLEDRAIKAEKEAEAQMRAAAEQRKLAEQVAAEARAAEARAKAAMELMMNSKKK